MAFLLPFCFAATHYTSHTAFFWSFCISRIIIYIVVPTAYRFVETHTSSLASSAFLNQFLSRLKNWYHHGSLIPWIQEFSRIGRNLQQKGCCRAFCSFWRACWFCLRHGTVFYLRCLRIGTLWRVALNSFFVAPLPEICDVYPEFEKMYQSLSCNCTIGYVLRHDVRSSEWACLGENAGIWYHSSTSWLHCDTLFEDV